MDKGTILLIISNLSARVAGKDILKGVNLEVKSGEVHAIMGPNGSGKSTLAQVLAGREDYEVTGGTVTFEGRDLLALPAEERARAGLFLGFQYPVEIPGVNNVYLLKAALNAKRKVAGEPEVDAYEFLTLIRQKMKLMHMSESFLTRGVNEGFSGGEKKPGLSCPASSNASGPRPLAGFTSLSRSPPAPLTTGAFIGLWSRSGPSGPVIIAAVRPSDPCSPASTSGPYSSA